MKNIKKEFEKYIKKEGKEGKEISLSEWQKKLWITHWSKGWNKIKRSPLENHALIVSEVAEATEAIRRGDDGIFIKDGKPEGEFIEIGDVIIRCFNYLTENGQNVEEILELKNNYNKTRKKLHGKKI